MSAVRCRQLLALLGAASALQVVAQNAPTFEVRQQVLKSLVQVTASDCADGSRRSGSGFALDQPGQVITAHHVVGGCRSITVSYEAQPAAAGKLRTAQVARVLATGDLSLLQVQAPPSVPSLRLAAPPASRNQTYAGFGYANGMPSGGDQEVRFSTGAPRLRDILPPDLADELRRIGSPIAVDREVLRFNVALQPGMSGGPIVNAAGEVIGIVAGGLKAGAAPASWGWPGEWVRDLLKSAEVLDRPVRVAGTYYSLSELQQLASARRDGVRRTCGSLEFVYTGRRAFRDLARGADDKPRLQHIINLSRENPADVDALLFDVWVHESSGATALTPAGYELVREADACAARSRTGPFQQIVWAAAAKPGAEVQWQSQVFENQVMARRVPYQFGFQPDLQLTTTVVNPATGMWMPGPQLRDNNMIFNRKGFSQPKRPIPFPGAAVPLAHSFETLVAKAGTFMGVATINDEMHPMLAACNQANGQLPGCDFAWRHLHEWTHFILATQLSTYPAY